MNRILILLFLALAPIYADDYTYLQMPIGAKSEQLDSKTLSGYFATEPEPRAIVLPTLRWKFSGGGPSPLIDRFRAAIKAGVDVRPLSEEFKKMIDSGTSKSIITIPVVEEQKGIEISAINWSGIYFLIGRDDFVTFGEVEGGYIVCTRAKVGFIEKKMREQAAPSNR